MRFLFILIFTIVFHLNGWSQEVLIKEDFEFYWPVQQYNIEGNWWLSYTSNSTNDPGDSRVLMMGNESVWNFEQVYLYDSIYVECRINITGSIMYPFYAGIQYSSDSISWINVDVPAVINTATYPYVRLYTQHTGKLIDNLLVVGYTNAETSNACDYDTNQDGSIGAQDLLAFLEVYGTFVDCD